MRKGTFASLLAVLPVIACSTVDATSEGDSALNARSDDPRAMCPGAYADRAPKQGANAAYAAGGQQRSFELLLPPASFTGPRPVFFAFHGTSESGASFSSRARLSDYAKRGFIVVAPDANSNGKIWPVWDGMRLAGTESEPNPDLELVDSLLGCVGAHFAIDRTRIFAGGHSAGGIFMNHLLRARSHVFAGGIITAGIFDFTAAPSNPPLEPMTVLVGWGGDNDGSGGGGVSGILFVEQAALSSQYFAAQPGVAQAYCRGNNLGHVWLPLNNWYIDILLARPKGTTTPLVLPPVPANAPVACKQEAFRLPPPAQTTCEPAAPSRAGCVEQCQFMADCALENVTVGAALSSELVSLGIEPGKCGGCVARCNAEATGTEDAGVLSCLAAKQATSTCGGGIAGALPLFDAINACCEGKRGSNVCLNLCRNLSDSIGGMFLPACPGIMER